MKGWVIPPQQSSEFVANMEHVLDIYKLPYDEDYPVVCMDESPKQLIEEVASTPLKTRAGSQWTMNISGTAWLMFLLQMNR